MSAYTPKMGGGLAGRVDDTEATPLSFSQASCDGELPAILRLSPADKNQKTPGSLKVQMQAACLPGESESTKTAGGLKISMQPTNVSSAPVKVRQGYVANAAAVADPELLQHIPRLKETLQALDSEMHANASSELDKRLLMHERILQLQGEKLNKAQQVVEQTAKAVGQILSTQGLHANTHKAMGKRLIAAEQSLGELQGKSELYSQLHHAAGNGIITMRDDVQALGEKSEMYSKLHHSAVDRMLGLAGQVDALGEKSEMYSKLHHSAVDRVLGLSGKVDTLGKKSELHNRFNESIGANVLEMKKKTEVYDRLHQVSNKMLLEREDASVGGEFSGAQLGGMQAQLDALKQENKELKEAMAKNLTATQKTASILAKLRPESGDVAAPLSPCTCKDGVRCTNCMAKTAIAGHDQEKHAKQRHHQGDHKHGTLALHSQLVGELESCIASSNKPGKKRR
jgi:hypothetical protein